MKTIRILTGLLGTNTYLCLDENGEAVIIDPAGDADKIMRAVAKNEAKPRAILLTHGHFDHIGAVDAIADAYGCDIYISHEDEELLYDAMKNSSLLFLGKRVMLKHDVKTFSDGDALRFGNLTFRVMETPGHTRGSVCFFAGNRVFTGDTLFEEGYGRDDLYGGDGAALMISLSELMPKVAGKTIHPGHGESKKF